MARSLKHRIVETYLPIAAGLLTLWLVFSLAHISLPLDKLLNFSGDPNRNTSNITRKQYRLALTKWNRQHITEYEATIEHSPRDWSKVKLVVHVEKPEEAEPESQGHSVVDVQYLEKGG